MKLLKCISLFCIYPLCMFFLGIYSTAFVLDHDTKSNDEMNYENTVEEKKLELTEDEVTEDDKDYEIENVEEVHSNSVENEKNFYYLKVENHYITVYESDGNTIFIHTDIMLDDLPEKAQQEIIDVKLIKNSQDLYDFLEAYSS
ncbi:MAG: hypothetical protein R3Y24_02100 [Eubacteriales bacterium]